MAATPEFKKWVMGKAPGVAAKLSKAPKAVQDQVLDRLWNAGGKDIYNQQEIQRISKFGPGSIAGDEKDKGFFESASDWAQKTFKNFQTSQATRQAEIGLPKHMANTATAILSGGILPPSRFIHEKEAKEAANWPVVTLKKMPDGSFSMLNEKGLVIGTSWAKGLSPGKVYFDPKTRRTVPVEMLKNYQAVAETGRNVEGIGNIIPSLPLNVGAKVVEKVATRVAPKVAAKVLAKPVTKALMPIVSGAVQGGLSGGLSAKQMDEPVLPAVVQGAGYGMIPGMVFAGLSGLKRGAAKVIASKLPDEIAGKLDDVMGDALSLEQRAQVADDLLKAKLPPKVAAKVQTVAKEIQRKRGNELIGKLMDDDLDHATRMEAFRKLREQFPDQVDDEVTRFAQGVDRAEVQRLATERIPARQEGFEAIQQGITDRELDAQTAAWQAENARLLREQSQRDVAGKVGAENAEQVRRVKTAAELAQQTAAEKARIKLRIDDLSKQIEDVDKGLLKLEGSPYGGEDIAGQFKTLNAQKANLEKQLQAVMDDASKFDPQPLKTPSVTQKASGKAVVKGGKGRVIQTAPGATVAAGGHTRAAQLEAEADQVEATDPERAKRLRAEAAGWRTVANAGLGAMVIGGGLKARQVAKVIKVGKEELKETGRKALSTFLKDLPESEAAKWRIGKRMIEEGDVRQGAMTMAKTKGIPPGFKDILADLVEAGDERVIKDVIGNEERIGRVVENIAQMGDINDPQTALNISRQFLADAAAGGKAGADDTVERIYLIKNLLKDVDSAPPEIKGQLYDQALDLSTEHFGKGTEAGRQLQVFTLMRRMTPEGMVHWGNKVVRNATNGKSGLTRESAEELARIGQKIKDGGNVIEAINDAKAVTMRDIPPGPWERVASWRYLAMLSNPSTHLKNIIGNQSLSATMKGERILAAGLDKLVGKFNKGQRSVVVPTGSVGAKAFVKGGKAGAKRAWVQGTENPLMRGTVDVMEDGAAIGKFDASGVRPVFKGIPGIEQLEKAVRTGLAAPDEAYFMKAYLEDLVGNIRAKAMNLGKEWTPGKDFVNQVMPEGTFDPAAVYKAVNDPDLLEPWMFDAAKKRAQEATLKDDSWLAQQAGAGRKFLSGFGVGDEGARRMGILKPGQKASDLGVPTPKDLNVGHFILPFSQVPANITTRVIERIPGVGLVKAGKILNKSLAENGTLTQQAQREFVDALSQNMTGFGAMGAGALLYGLGVVRTKDPDRKIEEAYTAQGFPAGSINPQGLYRGLEALASGKSIQEAQEAAKPQAGDTPFNPDSLDPFYTLGYATAAAEAGGDRGDVGNRIMSTLQAFGESMEDRSFLSGLKGITREIGYQDSFGAGLGIGLLKGAAGSFFPRVLSKPIEAGEPVADTEGMGTLERMKTNLQRYNPARVVGRGGPPEKTDKYGNTMIRGPQDGKGKAVVRGLLSPFNVDEYKGDKTIQSDIEMLEATRSKQGKVMRLEGQEYEWDGEKERELQKRKNEARGRWLKARTHIKGDEEKERRLSTFLSREAEKIKRDMIRKYKIERVK